MATANRPPRPGPARRLKQRLRGWLKSAWLGYVHTFRRFTPAQLQNLLRRLGVEPGDTVLTHVAYNNFLGFQGGPADVITAVEQALGPTGTLLMPTLPFGSTAVEFVRTHPLVDLPRTPSAMGFVTEVFRRLPGVVRSVHPTHPVAARGARAEELTSDHWQAQTPCGRGTPYLRLTEAGGKILFLGTDIGTMTFYHGVEEVLEPRLPFSPFTAEWFEVQTRDAAGRLYPTRTRLYDPEVSARRDMTILGAELQKRGLWREGKVALLRVALVAAADVLRVCEEMAGQGRYCYRAASSGG